MHRIILLIITDVFMLDKLKDAENRFENIESELAKPETMQDMERFTSLMKERANLAPVIEKYREYKKALSDADEALALLETENDPELREMADEELKNSKADAAKFEEELKILLLPKDPMDEKNVMIEIRAGAGGDEAALFAGVLYRMYTMYADMMKYKTETVSMNETGLGGFREITFMITGNGAYSRFKYESGVHRVQRVPETESSGRIHTSTATVAVLPEAEEVEFEINPADLQIDTYRSSGAGGQHVNKTESAIRITHLPSGVVVECQDERSQYKNKDRAMKILRSKLYEAEQQKQAAAIAAERKSQVGSGDRSDRIRTYNFPQNRVTDHRLVGDVRNFNIQSVLNGDLDPIIDALITADQAEKLKRQAES